MFLIEIRKNGWMGVSRAGANPAPNLTIESAFKSENESSPVVCKDLRWTGNISTAFYEIWTLDSLTRLATKSGKRTRPHYSYVQYLETTSDIGSLAG